MNKTFKIVFNKARGALMVANEITGSVQKKGVQTVAAVTIASSIGALALLSAPFAQAKQISLSGAVDATSIVSLSEDRKSVV